MYVASQAIVLHTIGMHCRRGSNLTIERRCWHSARQCVLQICRCTLCNSNSYVLLQFLKGSSIGSFMHSKSTTTCPTADVPHCYSSDRSPCLLQVSSVTLLSYMAQSSFYRPAIRKAAPASAVADMLTAGCLEVHLPHC